jgi:hypothetical protein
MLRNLLNFSSSYARMNFHARMMWNFYYFHFSHLQLEDARKH